MNNRNHVKCLNEKKCLSLLHTIDDCLLEKKVPFRNLCNGLEEFVHEDLIRKEMLTDESNCENWPCENLYSRCDGIWNCPNGEDESHCLNNSLCLSNSHPCLSLSNHSFICLSSNRIHDGIVERVIFVYHLMRFVMESPHVPKAMMKSFVIIKQIFTKIFFIFYQNKSILLIHFEQQIHIH